MSEYSMSSQPPRLKSLEQTKVSKELQKKFREVDLGKMFIQHHEYIQTHRVGYSTFAKVLLEYGDTSPVEDEMGMIQSKYEDAIHHSIDSFLQDCIEWGVLEVADDELIMLSLTDPTLCEFEGEGFKIQFNRSYYSVYQERMDTTGEIDMKPNGDYAVEGVTAENALSW